MGDKLIINARRELGWRRRILSDTTTVALWLVWIYLWLPAFHKLREVIHLRLGLEPAALEVFETVDPISVRHSLAALLGTCTSLLLWTLLPRGKVTRAHSVTTPEDYARAFQLTTGEITAARNSRIAIVHHDDEGAIVGLEPQA